MRVSIHTAALLVAVAMVVGCSTTPKSEQGKEDLQAGADRAQTSMTTANASLRAAADAAYGYVIFPKIGKGGIIVGGAYGRGIVHEQGQMIGYAEVTQASVGAQLGGQTYSELILFETKEALDRFKQNKLEFAANASAVIVKSGVGTAGKYENGVAIYIMPRAGAMAEASVGGQKFTFVPGENAGATTRPTTKPATY